jgi:uncharacterized protein YdcH (DUF465 family)
VSFFRIPSPSGGAERAKKGRTIRLQQEAEQINMRIAAAEEHTSIRESQLPYPQALQTMLQQVLGTQDRLLTILREEMQTHLQAQIAVLRTKLQSGK